MTLDRRLSVAPMMDWTDRHCRYFHRLLTRRTLLYTEMITTGALLQGDSERLLRLAEIETPVALQVGGDDPGDLAECARRAEAAGYDEINLNVGCPSQRVQRGRFGACLMREPHIVAAAVEAMRAATRLPVTVKHRIGVDDLDRYRDLRAFVDTVAGAGCTVFIVHARKAWLKGLSPKQNRTVPPLRHADVHRLKQERSDLTIVLNGGIQSLDEAMEHNRRVDGVMLGRAAYHDPWLLAAADRRVFGNDPGPAQDRAGVVAELEAYARDQVVAGESVARIGRHALGLFHGVPGARAWRRSLSESAPRDGADPRVFARALALQQAAAGRSPTRGGSIEPSPLAVGT